MALSQITGLFRTIEVVVDLNYIIIAIVMLGGSLAN
jgi:hypothetical protein